MKKLNQKILLSCLVISVIAGRQGFTQRADNYDAQNGKIGKSLFVTGISQKKPEQTITPARYKQKRRNRSEAKTKN